ncbi:hypothetical protein GCM10010156_17860 [Planobispora rosea]|uniref:Uncharacterized protein n=1 Tax=Planobispora rosea TaxID=35762 RepID=A0A8J3S315_PLARO|nr:hypothetical protein [Planobispora rosea]GGS59755.1 hypothetical protein GCM10010156_17860 [Planobispora rosea]GIH84114.1 hypothetical protein Pro02_25220 [Planobispora rosea]
MPDRTCHPLRSFAAAVLDRRRSPALAATAGFLPAVVVHMIIGYTSFVHLAPVYLGIALTALALALARPYLCAGR